MVSMGLAGSSVSNLIDSEVNICPIDLKLFNQKLESLYYMLYLKNNSND